MKKWKLILVVFVFVVSFLMASEGNASQEAVFNSVEDHNTQ